MNCRIVELRNKEVISLKDGCKFGCVSDVEIDTCCGRVVAIVIYGHPKLFGLLGREPDFIIPWEKIEVIGEETILVSCDPPRPKRHHRRDLLKIFS